VALVGAVRTFKPGTLAQARKAFLRNNVPTWHHHWRVLVCCLFLRNRTDENGMKEVGRWEGDFNLLREVRSVGHIGSVGAKNSMEGNLKTLAEEPLQVIHFALSTLSALPS
jgi:hypothetical protein